VLRPCGLQRSRREQFLTFAALTGAGDHIVASASLYGGTVTQLNVTLRRFGVETTFVTGSDPADYAVAITGGTKLGGFTRSSQRLACWDRIIAAAWPRPG